MHPIPIFLQSDKISLNNLRGEKGTGVARSLIPPTSSVRVHRSIKRSLRTQGGVSMSGARCQHHGRASESYNMHSVHM